MGKTREEKLASDLAMAVDAFGLSNKKVAKYIASEHRTTQQNIMRLMLAIIRGLAENFDKGYYDDRNEATVRLAKKIVESIEGEDALPLI